jgi:hypothetical protein
LTSFSVCAFTNSRRSLSLITVLWWLCVKNGSSPSRLHEYYG